MARDFLAIPPKELNAFAVVSLLLRGGKLKSLAVEIVTTNEPAFLGRGECVALIGRTKGEPEVDILNRGARVGRPRDVGDPFASLCIGEVVSVFRAVVLVVSLDFEGAGDVSVLERGVFFIFHAYTIPRITKKARDFFAISETFFVDVFSNERFILQVGTLLEQHVL